MDSFDSCEVSYIALFASARQVIKAEKALAVAGVHVTVRSVPEEYSSECGMCLAFPSEELPQFASITESLGYIPQIHEYKFI